MNLRTPLIASLAVVSALGGVAAAAIALPSGSAPEPTAGAVVPSAPPEVRTETIHVVRRDKDDATSRSAAPASTPTVSRSSSFDDSGHHGRGGDDDSGHGRGRGRGRGGDDD
jgi:hypothetical protein